MVHTKRPVTERPVTERPITKRLVTGRPVTKGPDYQTSNYQLPYPSPRANDLDPKSVLIHHYYPCQNKHVHMIAIRYLVERSL